MGPNNSKPNQSTLYYVPRTIASPLVQILLELELVPSEIVVVRLSFTDLKKEKILKLNPMGTSPTFITKHGDVIWESGAILMWILSEYDTDYKLHPSAQEVKLFSASLQLRQFIIATVYPFVAKWFLHTLKPKEDHNETYLNECEVMWTGKIARILTEHLGSRNFMVGDQISVVDFLVVKPLGNADSLGMLEKFGSLKDLLERIKSRSTYDCAYA